MSKKRYELYRYRYLKSPQLNLKTPIDVTLELASICNMRCRYCYHADNKPPFIKQIMWPDVFKPIIRQAAQLEVPAIKLNWRGEPTMNPYLLSYIKYIMELANSHTFIDRISNSNFNFNPKNEHIFEAFSYQTKVKISYDSFRKDVFEAQRPGGNHDRITSNIDRFYNLPYRDNIIVIQGIRTSLNKDEDFEKEVERRWPSAEVSIHDCVNGRTENNVSDLLEKHRTGKRKTCKQAHCRLVFSAFGDATLCCPDIKEQIKLGNIKEKSMYDIFNSNLAKEIRGNLLDNSAFKCEPCKSCSSFETYQVTDKIWDS